MVAQLCEYIKNHWITHLNRWIIGYANYISKKLLFLKHNEKKNVMRLNNKVGYVFLGEKYSDFMLSEVNFDS